MKYITTDTHPELKEGIELNEIDRLHGTSFKTPKGWGQYDHLDVEKLLENGYIKESEDNKTKRSMKSKQERLAELEMQLFDIQNQMNVVNGESEDNFALIKVVPDRTDGFTADTTILAISEDKENLVSYCEQEHNYTPVLSDSRRSDGAKPCDTWYKLQLTKIQLIGYPVT